MLKKSITFFSINQRNTHLIKNKIEYFFRPCPGTINAQGFTLSKDFELQNWPNTRFDIYYRKQCLAVAQSPFLDYFKYYLLETYVFRSSRARKRVFPINWTITCDCRILPIKATLNISRQISVVTKSLLAIQTGTSNRASANRVADPIVGRAFEKRDILLQNRTRNWYQSVSTILPIVI